MSIFDKIKNALFHRHAQAAPAATPAASAQTASASAVNPATPSSVPAPAAPATPAAAASAAPAAPAAVTPAAGTPAPVSIDVASIMDAAVKESGQKLNWRTSIVDTMKALGLDSDLAARKELAHELNYTGDAGDSATMNIWLQKALMKKLAENGGIVPADLMD